MKTCTFFGHRECPDTLRPVLRSQIEELICIHGADMFYVGSQGQFDALVRSVLRELSERYPQIRYAVVLPYLPRAGSDPADYADTMLPEGAEAVHPRYAIAWRNNWMLAQSDYVVTYITHDWGGAAQFAAKARKKKKTVLNLVQEKEQSRV